MDNNRQFALNHIGQVVSIHSLVEQDRADFECLGCRGILRPVMGTKRRKHFRHKVDCDCADETYLHRTAKKLFIQNYKSCLEEPRPFLLEFKQPVYCSSCQLGPCDDISIPASYDLTTKFKTVLEEQVDDTFIPDVLLLTDQGDKIYLEVAVTHECTSLKISSGVRILEVKVSDEDDLELFTLQQWSVNEKRIIRYNFEPKVKVENRYGYCDKDIFIFLVTSRGKAVILKKRPHEYDSTIKQVHRYAKLLNLSGTHIFVREVEEAWKIGVPVKNCHLCRYHAVNQNSYWNHSEYSLFCKLRRGGIESNDAASCDAFMPDPKVFKSRS